VVSECGLPCLLGVGGILPCLLGLRSLILVTEIFFRYPNVFDQDHFDRGLFIALHLCRSSLGDRQS
jgi:hypothetical protein